MNEVAQCKKCGSKAFSFRWHTKTNKERLYLMVCHDGLGYQLEDAIIRCEKCGTESRYNEEDFIEIKREG